MEEHLDMPLSSVLKIIQDRVMERSTYFGVETLKCPTDFWVYQEIISNHRPDVIIEIGNNCGGSTLALAHMLDVLGKGRVIGIDISHAKVPDTVKSHPRITLIEDDACKCFGQVREMIKNDDRVLVIEDSSHTYENTLNVMRCYAELIKPGDYMIVEDSICHHGLPIGPVPGPYEAIESFMDECDDFEVDRSKESFLITWNPKGYLRRKGGGSVPLSHEGADRISFRPNQFLRILKLFIPPILLQGWRKFRP